MTLFPNPVPANVPDGAPLCAVAVDAEEDFDWGRPVRGTAHDVACMKETAPLMSICGAYGIVPTFLLTYPVLDDADVVRSLRRHVEAGRCALGIQLHTWVTPPMEEPPTIAASFATNLGADLEERKLLALRDRFMTCFGSPPRIFRAGRYGLSPHTARLLERHGFEIDVSIAPGTNFADQGGPDYAASDLAPFWFGENRNLLELPLCRGMVGWGGAPGRALLRAAAWAGAAGRPVVAALARARLAERVTLSPEGNDFHAMRRLITGLRQRGHGVFVLSFHSSSLAAGRNPYVRTRADLHQFYDRLSAALDFVAGPLGGRFVSVADVPVCLSPRHLAGPPFARAA